MNTAVAHMDKVTQLYESRMHCYLFQFRFQEVLDTALEILEKLGLRLPSHPTEDDIRREQAEVKSLYEGIPVESLVNLPRMADPAKRAIMRIAAKAVSASTFVGQSQLYQFIILKAVNLSIRYGNAIESPYFLAVYAVSLCVFLRDFDTGYRFGKLAMALLESAENMLFRSRTIMAVYGKVWHFKQHLRTTLAQLLTGHQSGLESGDLE